MYVSSVCTALVTFKWMGASPTFQNRPVFSSLFSSMSSFCWQSASSLNDTPFYYGLKKGMTNCMRSFRMWYTFTQFNLQGVLMINCLLCGWGEWPTVFFFAMAPSLVGFVSWTVTNKSFQNRLLCWLYSIDYANNRNHHHAHTLPSWFLLLLTVC